MKRLALLLALAAPLSGLQADSSMPAAEYANTQLSDPEIFKDYEKAGVLQSRAEEIEMLLLEKLERWEWLEAKQNGEAV